jgi:hypothetical protein
VILYYSEQFWRLRNSSSFKFRPHRYICKRKKQNSKPVILGGLAIQLHNFMVRWIALPFNIWVILDSNLGVDTSYPYRFFCGFSQSLWGNTIKHYLKLGHDHFLLHPFKFIIH